MTIKHPENNQEQPQNNISKAKDFVAKNTNILVAALAITGAMASTEVAAQS